MLGTGVNARFLINVTTGEVSTRIENAFDYEIQDEVIIQVQARDEMNGTNHITIAQLSIEVIDVNDETPVIRVVRNLCVLLLTCDSSK